MKSIHLSEDQTLCTDTASVQLQKPVKREYTGENIHLVENVATGHTYCLFQEPVNICWKFRMKTHLPKADKFTWPARKYIYWKAIPQESYYNVNLAFILYTF